MFRRWTWLSGLLAGAIIWSTILPALPAPAHAAVPAPSSQSPTSAVHVEAWAENGAKVNGAGITQASGSENCTSKFTDVPDTDPACVAINYLVGEGILKGYPDGTFRPAHDQPRRGGDDACAHAGHRTPAVRSAPLQ